jgi:KipI family sensor histidine kinase inhibitor
VTPTSGHASVRGIRPVGDAALTVELGDTIDPVLNARVRSLDERLHADPPPGLVETVPTFRSLLVLYDADRVSFADMAAAVARFVPSLAEVSAPPGRRHVIATRYGGEDGPDLAAVASRCGLSEAEVVELHAGRDYVAFMLGFTPGFAYLGLTPEALETPRLATPRLRIPAGSVGIAGRQTAIYPSASPGGWSLIGRTSARPFDPHREPPALILPGDAVRFAAVAELEDVPAPSSTAADPAHPAIRVIEAGLLTTVQDVRRVGLRRLGVSGGGAADAEALARANAAVGNAPGAAGIECTVSGPALAFLAGAHFAVAGADLGAVLERADLGSWPVPPEAAVRARPGNVLRFEARLSGCRAYVAVAGGIDVPLVLGSRSTDMAAGIGGIGGRPLRAGDVVGAGTARLGQPTAGAREPHAPSGVATVRVVMGPQDHLFAADARQRFLSETWEVAAGSDRVGCRLDGPPVRPEGPAEIVSDGMVPGCVQVAADGKPMVMLADGPTTGGYPKIATVISADVGRVAQLVPGEGRVRFTAVTIEEAQRVRRKASAVRA